MTLTCADLESGFSEFRFVRELGGGTFKVACLVQQGDEEVVLKVSRETLDDPEANLPERLRREIDGMRTVANPHVAAVLEGPSTRDVAGGTRVYYLEPFYPGGTLQDQLTAPFEASRLRDLGSGLLEGVVALEAAGIVHRDIKPENIAFTAAGDSVLLDLGIAYFMDLTEITEPLGVSPRTPLWAAPEQFEMRSTVVIDSRTDLFQVGMVCFAAATGVHPFEPADNDYVKRLGNGEINEAALERAAVPEPVASVLRRLLQPAPNRRYRKAELGLEAFREAT